MNKIITYDNLSTWRDICECLYRFKVLDYGRFTEFGLSTEDISLYAKTAYNVLAYKARPHRQALWDAWRIQLVRYVSSDYVGKKNQGWVLKSRWERKIDFLEKVVLFDADPFSLPMPWLIPDMPKPWDAVLGGRIKPPEYGLVLGGSQSFTQTSSELQRYFIETAVKHQ